jgi:uncharacterized protein YvpB
MKSVRSLLLTLTISSVITAVFAVLPASAQTPTVQLNVTFHKQEHSLSCEVAALKTALQEQGITVSESELISQLPFDSTPKQPGVWGDPNQGFVGSIDGRMLVTGYGVHWDPIAKLGAKYTTTEVMRHGSAQQLAEQIAQGNPVIIWGYYGQRGVYNWKTPLGSLITAINGEHTMVVYGFDGPATAPTAFYIMDPAQGKMQWTTEQLIYNWSALGHIGVVVKQPKQWVRVLQTTQIWELDNKTKTRQLIPSWAAFVQRGGTSQAVKPIDQTKLLTYKVGTSIN